MDSETLTKLIPPTVSLIVTSIFGLFIGVLIEKFKNRYRTITYSIFSQKVKPSLSENLGGHLKINLGDREIDTLKVVTVEIENKSSVDIEDVVVKFTLEQGALFQGNEGFLQNNFAWLYWDLKFTDIYNQTLQENNSAPVDKKTGFKEINDHLQAKIDFVLSNRSYFIPVFNRKEKAIFNFLIEDSHDGSEIIIFPSIVHKSVNFTEDNMDEKKAQKNLWMGIGIGLFIVSCIFSIMVYNNPEQKSLIIWSGIIGVSYSILGVLVLNVFRKIIGFFK